MNEDLRAALLSTADGFIGGHHHTTVIGAARLLAEHPELAARWAAAITAHRDQNDPARPVTTVRVMAMVETHTYQAKPGQPHCQQYLQNLDNVCLHDADHAVHRVEVLPPEHRRALELWSGIARYEPGEAVSGDVMRALTRLGLAVDAGLIVGQMRVTARGRAWLDVHLGGEGSLSR
jgi:hypothetical protein